jgi:hypothetical protein
LTQARTAPSGKEWHMDHLRRTVFLAFVAAAAVLAIGQESTQTESAKGKWFALHEDGYAAFSAGRYADGLADFAACSTRTRCRSPIAGDFQ